MTAEIIHLSERYVARCLCGGSEWEIIVDNPGDFERIEGLQCMSCEEIIEFEMRVVGRRKQV